MKLTKQSNRIKSRIVSFTVAIALILCAVLSLGYMLPDRIVRAEDGTPPPAKVTDGIRFVQVAAGYDFAIGLTYDRKLYGWSTKANRTPDNMSSLGDYYTATPTEINVTFRRGPYGNFTWSVPSTGDNTYHSPITDDKIKSIAATGTTAAFLTEKGFIYTWGVDTEAKHDVEQYDGTPTNYLLLRATSENYPWYVPYIINYQYYGTTSTYKYSTELMIPTGNNKLTSLAAGEYNYIFMFARDYQGSWSTNGNMYHVFVWGSALYNAVNRVPADSYTYLGNFEIQVNGRKVFNTFVSTPTDQSSTGNMSVVAGGYTVGINNTAVSGQSSLQLHGRNFITTQGVTAVSGSSNEFDVVNTSKLVTSDEAPATADINFGSNKYKAAIAGSNGVNTQQDSFTGKDTERYYARQDGSKIYNVSAADFIINSKSAGTGNDNKITKYSVGVTQQGEQILEDALKPMHYAVSLGNDIGYGISGDKLFGWGDNAKGQLVGVSGANKDEPTPLLSSYNFVSVAAGKQMSPATRNVRAFYGNTLSSTFDGTNFADAVKNQEGYITGALDDDGVIHAWSNGIGEKQLIYVGDPNNPASKKEKFAAVYSGYGEILYAITVSGKLVRITKNSAGDGFDQYVYDEFYYWKETQQGATITTELTKIENWAVDKTNKVEFTVPTVAENAPTAQKVAPDLGNATFYVWSATASAPAVAEGEQALPSTVKINGGAQTAYKPLVSDNKIGDAYRIVGLTAADASINYLKADNLTNDDSQLTYYAPKFYFDSKDNGTDGILMSTAQQQNMFTYRPVYGENGEGVGIYIEPKQSSKGKNIRVDFYIARYNSYGKYSNAANGDNAIYYDYKQCSIIFSIADTDSVVTYSAYVPGETSDTHGPSNIPLLDPNNLYNTHYSLAVQDVSTGVNELIKFLTGKDTEVNDNFKTAVMTEMKKDKGFPDKAKIADGDLTYYLNADDLNKYNNDKTNANDYAYQFIYTDRDSERIMLINSGTNTSIMSSSAVGVTGKVETITVKIEYLPSSYGITNSNANLAAENFGATLVKTIATDFDNRYGLYDFAYTTESGKNYLSFKYDVVTFTATGATGMISYGSGETTSVTGYDTGTSNARAAASFRSYTLNTCTYEADKGYYVAPTTYDTRNHPTANVNNFAYVYSMPTLRLKGAKIPANTDKNGQAGGTKNTFTETHDDKQREPLYVGDTYTIRLSDYVDKTTDQNVKISFSFNNKVANDELAKFSGQFKDYTGHNMPVVTLSANTILVHPTTAAPINFTVEVQRFANADQTKHFIDADNRVDEKIYLTFNFNNIVGFDMTKNTQAKTEYLITETITVDLFGEGEGVNNAGRPFVDIVGANNASLAGTAAAANAYRVLKSNAQIYGISSSEDGKPDGEKLFTYTNPQNSTDKTKFTITPKRSGSGTILFSPNIYDKSVSFKLDINVSAVTELGDNNKLTIIDDQYITVSELNEALRSANSFNDDVKDGKYRILYDDPTAIQWEDEDGNSGKPPFVDRVVFESKDTDPTIRVVSSNSTTQQSKTYKMIVRYTNADSTVASYADAPAGSIIQIVIPVVSGKIKLQDKDKGGDLIAVIDCRNPGKDNWWKTEGERLDTRVTIELQYLLNLDNTEAPDQYKIFLVSADSAATEYFQYDKGAGDRSIEITPKMNTPKNYELNVSVYQEGKNTTKVLSFEISVTGILTTLPVMTNDDGIIGYGNIWLYSTAIVFGVLFIIFMIRFIVYMRRRSKQRAIIKRNQELIRLRDRMHGKANAASREQLVKSKLKMEDSKYAKMFNDMRRDKEEESGVALVNSDLAATADKKTKKKKKGGKKSVAELKAELAAKKAAFAAAQAGNAQPVNPFATEVPLDGGFVAPDGGFADGGGYAADGGYAPNDGGFADGGDFGAQSIDGSEIIFDASDMGDGNM